MVAAGPDPKLLTGVPHRDYHADDLPGSPRFSRSAAVRILQSPLACHAWHPKLGAVGAEDEEEQEDRAAGSLYHELLLGGGLGLAVIDHDSFRTNAAKDAKAEALANGLQPVIRAKYEAALVHHRAIHKRLAEHGVRLVDFETEVTALWHHGETACKSRLDALLLAAGRIVDLKCKRVLGTLQSFERGIPAYGLDIQAYTQRCAVEAAHPALAGRIQHDFVVVQIVPPYDIMLVSLGPSKLSIGESRWNRALKRWRSCLASGQWPGVGRVPDIQAKEWELTEEMTSDAASSEPDWTKGD